jgi:mannose-6-phosphate isomerase
MEENVRPWGRYDILYDGDDCKVKRITVKPGKRLSYQYHHKRDELWKVISGVGCVTLDGIDWPVQAGSDVNILKGVRHRVENIGRDEPLVFIEIQTGTYFGEDDIVRLEDDYGRK